jgi:hypothetical protein
MMELNVTLPINAQLYGLCLLDIQPYVGYRKCLENQFVIIQRGK